MTYQISNGTLTVKAAENGGALTSITDNSGMEYLWQPDPAYWTGQAPIMFPICGSIRGDQAVLKDGRKVTMPRHGLIRKLDFKFVSQTTDSMTFEISATEDTKKNYPFDFTFRVTYTIKDNELTTEFTVCNHSDVTMPFFTGGHPAFRCPIQKGEKFEDYRIGFSKEETVYNNTTDAATGLIEGKSKELFLDHANIVSVSHKLFADGPISLKELQSKEVCLYHKDTHKGVKVSFGDFPYLVLWSKESGADFVAMEPWLGYSTSAEEDDVFEHKQNVQYVEPGKEKKYQFTITIL